MTDESPLFPAIEPLETGWLDTGEGHQVYWERCGNPQGIPVLFVHGGPGAGCSPTSRRPNAPSTTTWSAFSGSPR